MANEPERPIEKLLRAAAKKRRDEVGAPLVLHPATRRLLQGEVARTFAKPERKTRSFAEFVRQLWPRFVWGVAIFAVLAVAVYVLLPVSGKGKREALLAKNEPMSEAAPAKQPLASPPVAATAVLAPAPAVVESNPARVAVAEPAPPTLAKSAGELGVERQPLLKDINAPQTDRKANKELPAAAAPQLADRAKDAETGIAASSGTLAQAPAGTINGAYQRQFGFANKPVPPGGEPATPAAPAPVPTTVAAASAVAADETATLAGDKANRSSFAYRSLPAVTPADGLSSAHAATDGLLKSAADSRMEARSVGVSQRFAQAAQSPKTKSSLADKPAPAHPVLASFEVEQAGTELWIVDADGSVYSGYLEVTDAVRRQRSVKAEASAASRAPQALGAVVAEKPAARLDAGQLPLQTYFFRVAGTNRSLHKKVVFTGNLMAASNSPSFQPFTNLMSIGGGLGGRRTSPTQPNLLPLLNSRISGKVVVGSGKAVEINAFPTSP